jgi:hypothetical protein
LVVPGSYMGDLCSSVNCDFHCDLVVQSYSLSVLPLGDILQSWFTKAIQVSLFLMFHLKLLRSWAHFCSVKLWVVGFVVYCTNTMWSCQQKQSDETLCAIMYK